MIFFLVSQNIHDTHKFAIQRNNFHSHRSRIMMELQQPMEAAPIREQGEPGPSHSSINWLELPSETLNKVTRLDISYLMSMGR